MNTEEFDYQLPAELIAQHPARRRADSRMLVLKRGEGRWVDARFRELPQFLAPGDLLVLNDSRVLPARLFGRRAGMLSEPAGQSNREHLRSKIEVLLVRPLEGRIWEALVRPGRKVRTGERIVFEGDGEVAKPRSREARRHEAGTETGALEAEIIGRGEFGLRTLRFLGAQSLDRALEKMGHVPLPPYIRRADQNSDRIRYQTIYARRPGSVAAPTAGLHFTKAVLDTLAEQGVERCAITLHVSLGTFRPVHRLNAEAHQLHPETFEVTSSAAEAINRALAGRRRIIAVGTTTLRTLEHVAAENGGKIVAGAGETRLFIRPGFPFRVAGGLLTNFHLPGTTLLLLAAAFAGSELIRKAYGHAVQERYRFYSYGDCMLIL